MLNQTNGISGRGGVVRVANITKKGLFKESPSDLKGSPPDLKGKTPFTPYSVFSGNKTLNQRFGDNLKNIFFC